MASTEARQNSFYARICTEVLQRKSTLLLSSLDCRLPCTLLYFFNFFLPSGQYSGAFNVTLPIDLISSMATLFVYIAFPEGQVAADTLRLKVSSCFRNRVSSAQNIGGQVGWRVADDLQTGSRYAAESNNPSFPFPSSQCLQSPFLLLFQVKLSFSDAVALPGSAVRLHLQAAPGSLCSIRAVDKSVLLLRPEAELSRDSVSHFMLTIAA